MTTYDTIEISDYCARHHDPAKSNRGTLYLRVNTAGECDWRTLIDEIRANWHRQKPGYRDGVILVPVPVTRWRRFTCPLTELREGDVFAGVYERRRPTETPRRRVAVLRDSMPLANYVDAVLYRGDVLDEDTSNPRSTDADWEVVTLLGKLTEEDQPMPPGTLMANHFLADGGTDTQMDPEQFIEALRVSFEYWSDKALVEVRS